MGKCMFDFLLFLLCILIQDSCSKMRDSILIPARHRYIRPKTQGSTFLREKANLVFFKNYRRYNQIEKFTKKLVGKNSSIAKVFSIGRSVEGRKLYVIKIGSNLKPAIWIDGGIHAREWISPSTVTYIAYKLINEYSKRIHRNEKNIVFDFCWYILPLLNPDGYEYSHEKDRMWRKNRNPKNDSCPGVDLNRNWGFHWNEGGASEDACSDVYPGESAFSEPETRAVSKFILKKMQRQGVIAFLTFHSFSQVWLYPWGWTKSLTDDHRELDKIAKKAADAIWRVNGTYYDTGSISRYFNTVVSGGSDDWAKGEAGIKYSYAVELPNKERYDFRLPKRYILPTAKEMWEGVKAFAKAISDLHEE